MSCKVRLGEKVGRPVVIGRNGRIRTCDPLTPRQSALGKFINDFSDGADFILHTHNLNAPKGTGTPSRSVKCANHDLHNQEKGV